MTTFAVCQQTVCTTVSFSCHAVVTVECAVCHVNSDDRLDLLVYKEKAKVFFFGSTATSKKRQIPILVRPFVRLHPSVLSFLKGGHRAVGLFSCIQIEIPQN